MPLSRINGKTRNNSSLMRTLKSWLAIASFLVISGCNNIGSMDFPGVYKISIPQGNIITQEMVDQLRPGMTKRQVIFVMGTPLVRDPYHQDRWDYVYNFQPGGGERGQERLSVLFQDDQLLQISGDFKPTEPETDG
jgi:outer membrane protein assembly factor BamE